VSAAGADPPPRQRHATAFHCLVSAANRAWRAKESESDSGFGIHSEIVRARQYLRRNTDLQRNIWTTTCGLGADLQAVWSLSIHQFGVPLISEIGEAHRNEWMRLPKVRAGGRPWKSAIPSLARRIGDTGATFGSQPLICNLSSMEND
jgi:hypothetical protein